jgi:hypothetical protein
VYEELSARLHALSAVLSSTMQQTAATRTVSLGGLNSLGGYKLSDYDQRFGSPTALQGVLEKQLELGSSSKDKDGKEEGRPELVRVIEDKADEVEDEEEDDEEAGTSSAVSAAQAELNMKLEEAAAATSSSVTTDADAASAATDIVTDKEDTTGEIAKAVDEQQQEDADADAGASGITSTEDDTVGAV